MFFLTFNDHYLFGLFSCKVFIHRPATRIPPMLVQYDVDANSSVCLPERLMVGECIHLQSGFLLLIGPRGKACRQQDCKKWKMTISK